MWRPGPVRGATTHGQVSGALLGEGGRDVVSAEHVGASRPEVTTASIRPHPPQGVRGRNADNTLLRSDLGWEPSVRLEDGFRATYSWIETMVAASNLPAGRS